jgi:hypothetical protein
VPLFRIVPGNCNCTTLRAMYYNLTSVPMCYLAGEVEAQKCNDDVPLRYGDR